MQIMRLISLIHLFISSARQMISNCYDDLRKAVVNSQHDLIYIYSFDTEGNHQNFL